MSNKDKFYKLLAYYPEIVRIKKFDKERFNNVLQKLGDINVEQSLYIRYNSNIDLKYTALALILKLKSFESLKFMNAYELLDIYLGNSEEFKSILDIPQKIIIVYFSGTEFENKRQADIIIQLGEYMSVSNRYLWVLSSVNLEQKYGLLYNWIKENEIEQRDLQVIKRTFEEI